MQFQIVAAILLGLLPPPSQGVQGLLSGLTRALTEILSNLPDDGVALPTSLPLVKRSPLLDGTVKTLEGGLGKPEAANLAKLREALREGDQDVSGDMKNLWDSLKNRFGDDNEAILRALPEELQTLMKKANRD